MSISSLTSSYSVCRFQDGAASANNPAALALSQARLLWPDSPIECLISLGSGAVPLHRREKSMSAYLDIGSVLIEVRCFSARESLKENLVLQSLTVSVESVLAHTALPP